MPYGENTGDIRVLLVDDSPTTRRHLRNIINNESDMFVIGEAGNGQEAIHLTRKLRPHIIGMDVNMVITITASESCKAFAVEIDLIDCFSNSYHRSASFQSW